MYILLKGAKKNVGDFFIFDRAKKLLDKFGKDKEFVEINRWESLDDRLDIINKSKAVILCGGPGYSKFFYPGVFPLTSSINKIKVPIVPFGLGWVGKPINSKNFYFSGESIRSIKLIHKKIKYSSCRDVITEDILKRNGIKNTLMTGCPTWYEVGSLGKKFVAPQTLKKIAVSLAQNRVFHQQNIELLRKLREYFTRLNPDIKLYAVFHRGWEKDEFTPEKEAIRLKKLKEKAEELGYETINAGYKLENIDFYKNCDLHIGYRVHAQIYFLSLRKPSFLLWEDGRGIGLSKSLKLNDVPAMSFRTVDLFDKLNAKFNFIEDFGPARTISLNTRAVDSIISNLDGELKNSFKSFKTVSENIDESFNSMKKFISTIPN